MINYHVAICRIFFYDPYIKLEIIGEDFQDFIFVSELSRIYTKLKSVLQ